MKTNLPPSPDAAPSVVVDPERHSADGHLFALGTLLGSEPPPATRASPAPEILDETRLVQLRLGTVSGLFAALRAKHPPTASHCLRVALGCSSWLQKTNVGEKERDEIEVAALLHDLGKLAVPDSILRKPDVLSPDEAALMTHHRQLGAEILSACCVSPSILEVMKCTPDWFDGTHDLSGRRGREIPLGARMIAIVDAFDSMTTDHVYRPAMSSRQAILELFENTGTQFDPELVAPFADLYDESQVRLDASVARHWLERLTSQQSDRVWQPGQPLASPLLPSGPDTAFQRELLQNMHDGVVFVDETLRIFFWNRGAEQLTGTRAAQACDRLWTPAVASLQDISGRAVHDRQCPVVHAVRCGSQVSQRYLIPRVGRKSITVEAHVVPVLKPSGVPCGATILLRDVSSETTLQHRVQKLHKRATRDPLTWVANRAEFDRLHPELVRSHLEQSLPYSLIMCDIDHFKQVNDQYGHQAGDEALIRFATLLRQSCRQGDLVARYGGEEFVIMCADCGSGSAAERAEEIRCELSRTPLEQLGGKGLTASFGVAELQPGDSAEALLRRADRALFQSKSDGRNRVTQLASFNNDAPGSHGSIGWAARQQRASQQLLEHRLITPVPLRGTAQRLRSFVQDHRSEIVSIDNNRVILQVRPEFVPASRRRTDRPTSLMVDVKLVEWFAPDASTQTPDAPPPRTAIHVIIRSRRWRDRRGSMLESARRLLDSLRAYLAAIDAPVQCAISDPSDAQDIEVCSSSDERRKPNQQGPAESGPAKPGPVPYGPT